ncbi:hypothetical protein V8G54_024049 [Vigna mungo]|uniref:Transposase MuDR plant domain-containing protein n=1 Tax=Vigna mungo TaxID=3915 RepID=A0AAQ3RS65_VIGMU
MHEGDEGGEDVEPEMHEGDEGGEDVELEMHEGDEGGEDVEPEMHEGNEEAEDVEPEMHEGDEGVEDVEPEGVGQVERTNLIDVVDTTVVDVAHDERTKANDVVEGNIEVEVREWCSSDDDTGEVSGMDGLVDINIECEYRDNDTCGNMDVDCSALSDDPELEDDDISDTSLFNDEWESEDLSSPEISDEESDHEEVEKGYGKFITFNMPKNMIDFKWEVGTYFGQKKDIMDGIKTYALENGRNLKFIKNDKQRIRLKCVGAKGACPWMTYFAYMEAVDTWQLRIVVDRHTCSREHKLGVFNAKWLSKKLEKKQ